ncbi:hypothetical protein CesoFtcFv8_016205 [Champsocephalus esox]|uniref:Uncharacterized protein n=2 Tax=Champsocephalus TaxID=52236 RepID=A0AAN8HJI6_CHAGU|nr:hypothetical protein CesoFtcFv8_016205 [Champsocephalus esox]KAK5918066.1 hypothetical protein CgunFtcFv8_002865 [Champsocephalus gunnari]
MIHVPVQSGRRGQTDMHKQDALPGAPRGPRDIRSSTRHKRKSIMKNFIYSDRKKAYWALSSDLDTSA